MSEATNTSVPPHEAEAEFAAWLDRYIADFTASLKDHLGDSEAHDRGED